MSCQEFGKIFLQSKGKWKINISSLTGKKSRISVLKLRMYRQLWCLYFFITKFYHKQPNVPYNNKVLSGTSWVLFTFDKNLRWDLSGGQQSSAQILYEKPRKTKFALKEKILTWNEAIWDLILDLEVHQSFTHFCILQRETFNDLLSNSHLG